MIKEALRDYIADINPDAVLFDNPSFDNSIIGLDANDAVVYDFSKMVEEMMVDDEISYEEAMEFIEYNTIRSLPYISEGTAPIIVYTDILMEVDGEL